MAGVGAGGHGDAKQVLHVAGSRRRQPAWEFDRPRQVRGAAVIIVDEEASDPPKSIGSRESRRDQLHGPPEGHAKPPPVENDGGRPTDESPVPHESPAGEERAGISGKRDVPQLGADDPAHHGGGDQIGGIVFGQLPSAGAPAR